MKHLKENRDRIEKYKKWLNKNKYDFLIGKYVVVEDYYTSEPNTMDSGIITSVVEPTEDKAGYICIGDDPHNDVTFSQDQFFYDFIENGEGWVHEDEVKVKLV